MDMMRTHFPYALKRLEDGSVVVLNREYKPLGFEPNKCGWVKYESLPITFKTKNGWARLAAQLGYELQPDTADLIFLYNGRTTPFGAGRLIRKNWDAYNQKLEKLASIKTCSTGTLTA